MRLLLLVFIVACQQFNTEAPVPVTRPGDARVVDARVADAGIVAVTSHIDLAVHAATAPCPVGDPEPIDHELFPGCPAAPYTAPFSVCPHGECPKPCRVELEARQCCPVVPYFETQAITYDARGRFLAATHVKGTESGNLLDVSCTYAGDHAAKCQYSIYGKPTVTTIAKRDDKGVLIATSNGGSESSDATYSYAGDQVSAMEAGRESSKYTYNPKHQLVRVDDQYKSEHTTTTYKYNAIGDVIEANANGQITTYSYDAKRRPITQTSDDNGEETSLLIFTYNYECSKN